MRYMMLIHHDEDALAEAPKEELWTEYAAFNEALAKAGAGFAAGERLESSASATIVRVRDGDSKVLDGPYAETKEQLAGYFVIDVPDVEEAITWAPHAHEALTLAIGLSTDDAIRRYLEDRRSALGSLE